MNKIAVVSMVKNEEDIIESFARHACSFADILLVANHQSSDRTRKILELLQSEKLPIQIVDLQDQAYDHSTVMTNLMRQVIDLGFDIILPMDADEFLIQSNGNSESLRQSLQNLDPEKCYIMQWKWFELVEPEENADRFILSRDFLIDSQPTFGPKTCIGARIARRHDLRIMKGGHSPLTPIGDIYPQDEIGSGIFNAHFPKRSAGQILSKTMVGWLTHMLKFGRYNRLSHDWIETAEDYLDRNIKPKFHLEHPMQTRELDGFRWACENRYTLGNIDPMKNLYRFAENLVEEKFRFEILRRSELVRIYILHDGNVSDTIDSLKSALDQTYPFRKIFIVARSNENIDSLFSECDRLNLTEEVGLIDLDDPAIVARGNGFTQFITSGDKLNPDKIFRSIEALSSDSYEHAIAICQGNFIQSEFMPVQFSDARNWLANVLDCKATINWIVEHDIAFSSGISGFLLRQYLVAENFELLDALKDSMQLKFFMQLSKRFNRFVWISEELIEKSRAWSESDRIEFENYRSKN